MCESIVAVSHGKLKYCCANLKYCCANFTGLSIDNFPECLLIHQSVYCILVYFLYLINMLNSSSS